MTTCSESDHIRKSSLKVQITNAWIDNYTDQDSDGYITVADIYFELESNKPANLTAIIGLRNTSASDASYYIYKQTESFNLNGSDVLYTSLGAESEKMPEGCYDFMIQIFNPDDLETVLAQISADEIEAISGVCFEDATQDQIVQFELSNPLYTPIDITINSIVQTANPGESTVFNFNGNPGLINVTAQTYGKTTQGTQIGLKMGWNFSADLTGVTYDSRELKLTSDYIFIYVTNNGTADISPFYVNYERAEQTVDNILLPNDNVMYSTGYYKAFTNTVVVGVFQGTQNAVFWMEETQHFIPWTDNQSVNLVNNFALSGQIKDSSAMSKPEMLFPANRNFKRRLWQKGLQPDKVYARIID